MDTWYNNLQKSSLTPPPITFQIVWLLLYTLIFLSIFIYIRNFRGKTSVWLSTGMILFLVQLLLNLVWSPVFFRLHAPCVALLVLVLLLTTLALTMASFYAVSPWSMYLLIPYLAWSLFALYLNAYICVANAS